MFFLWHDTAHDRHCCFYVKKIEVVSICVRQCVAKKCGHGTQGFISSSAHFP